MNSKENNQTDNMANEKKVSSSRGGTTENYSKQPAAESTGQAGGGNKQSGTKGTQGGSQQSEGGMGSPRTERGAGTGGAGQSQADLGNRPPEGGQGAQQSQGGQGSRQASGGGSAGGGGGYHVSQPRGHKAYQSLEQEVDLEMQEPLYGMQSEQSELDEGSQQSESGAGSRQSQRGSGSRQSQGGSGSQQSTRGPEEGQQPLADGLSQQAQGRPDQKTGSPSKGGSTLYGTGQGQHAQSSGGNEGADKADKERSAVKEGAGMPAQGGAGRSAQAGTEKDAGKSGGTMDKGQKNAQREQSPGSGKPQGGRDE